MGPEDQHEQPAEKDGYEKWLDEQEICLKCGSEGWYVPALLDEMELAYHESQGALR